MGGDELREHFLSFFEARGHKRLPSASLVPHGDPTLLLTGAGMVPFKPYFLGTEAPPHRRVTTAQRCLRTPDIDRVGLDDRHATFFEMLGNFSFGDYFKDRAIAWAWEFSTRVLGFPEERLWVTIYVDDDEAHRLWQREAGLPPERIVRLGREDNFWEIGVGPCGPCSEIYLDRGEAFGCGRAGCKPGCDCDRFMEFWNLVFIQFHQDEQGRLTPLAAPGIDTGLGLERACTLLQDTRSIFEIDLIRPILDRVAEFAGVEYGRDPRADVSLRVITEHMRGVTFLVHDGVLPSNEGRGYVLRRLLRRAVRHARLLGIDAPFLSAIVDTVAKQMKNGYPEVMDRLEYVKEVVTGEEERFQRTLAQGTSLLRGELARQRAAGSEVLPGSLVFRLYDTYGFPLELTRELAREEGFRVDDEGFAAAMAAQREQARGGREDGAAYLGGAAAHWADLAREQATRFLGYEQLEAEARVLALLVDGRETGEVRAGAEVELLLDETPFYPEGGGQVPDTGTLTGPRGRVAIADVQRVGSLIVHRGRVVEGALHNGDRVVARVDAARRWDTARNHTATHLLHKSLREILGEHARQAGSLVAPDRLRFDFTHMRPVSPEELSAVEERVNEQVLRNLPVRWEVMAYREAIDQGAMALFGEKYGERVRVVSVGEYSKELCGGTHVRATGEIGLFKIVGEGSVAAGVRRVEAVTGQGVLRVLRDWEGLMRQVAGTLDTVPEELPRRANRLVATVRQLERQVDTLRSRLAQRQVEEILASAERIGDVSVVVASVPETDPEGLRALGDRLRERLGSGVVVLGSQSDGKALFVAMATADLAGRVVHAGEIVRAAATRAGGGGGGRPDMAQAGGREPGRLGEALQAAREVVRRQLSVPQRKG